MWGGIACTSSLSASASFGQRVLRRSGQRTPASMLASVENLTDERVAHEHMIAGKQDRRAQGEHEGVLERPMQRPMRNPLLQRGDERQMGDVDPIGCIGDVAANRAVFVEEAYCRADETEDPTPQDK